jgi:hypothetical protein
MKIGLCYVRDDARWPKFQWLTDGFGTDHETTHIHDLDALTEANETHDLIVFMHREPGPGRKQIVNVAKKCVWVQWWFDLFIRQSHQDLIPLYGPLAYKQDFILCKERACIDEYREHGIVAHYLDQACPANYPETTHNPAPAFDVMVVGTLMHEYGQRHQDVQSLVQAGFRVAWAGEGGVAPSGVTHLPWVHPNRIPDTLSKAAVSLCVDLRQDVDGYWSDRLWLSAGSGAATLWRTTENSIPCVVTYNDTESLIARTRELVSDCDGRRKLGEQSRTYVLQNHTYHHRCKRLLELVDALR